MTTTRRQTQQNNDGNQQRRMTAVLTGFLVITAVIIAKIVFTATAYQEQRTKLRQHALVHETVRVPGLRGTLVDHANRLMAQSHRCLEINDTCGKENATVRKTVPLDDKVNWEHIAQSEQLKPQIVFRRTIRELTNPQDTTPQDSDRKLKVRRLGVTETSGNTGLEVGVSGLELKWNDRLKAELVTCKILKDRRRVIISSATPNGHHVHLTE